MRYTELQKIGILFLQHFFEKSFMSVGGGKKIIKNHLNEITKCLITLAENNSSQESELSLKLLHYLFNEFGEDAMVFDQLPDSENFLELCKLQSKRPRSPNNIKDLLKILDSSILIQKCSHDSLGTIRQYVS